MQALAQLLAGMPDYAIAASGNTANSLRSIGMNYYAQDDIHVVPRLLLNVGVRWEYNGPPVETHNRFSVPDLSANAAENAATCSPAPDCWFIQAGTGGVPRATYNPTYTDIAPRIGVAWRPLKTERFVVRSAYGIFYDDGIFNMNVLPRFNPPFYDLSLNINGGTNVIQNILSQPGQAIPEPEVSMISRNFRDGYVQQWNADLQYELQANWMIDLAYVGSKGTHLPDAINLDQPNPATGVAPYPWFASSTILDIESAANSSYNALQFRSEKRVGHDLGFLVAYTFSKSIDDVSSVFGGSVGGGLPQNSNDLSADRALSDFDARHRFVLSSVYDLPFARMWAKDSGFRKALLSDWQMAGIMTAQTGSPFTVNLATPSAACFASSAFGNPCRPDLISNPFTPGPVPANPNPACQTTISQGGLAADVVRQPGSWFNTCAFVSPAAGQFGNAGRNILTGPGFTNLDFSLSRTIQFRTEGHRLQIRGEFFNLLNHPNFDIPNHTFETPNEAMVLSANEYGNKPPRQIQLGLKYIF
jgi:hypothetical protein